MYNLIVSGASGTWDAQYFALDAGRFLEYTDSALKKRLADLSEEAIAELQNFPTLFAYELPSDAPARVGWIKDIRRRQGQIRISFTFDESVSSFKGEVVKTNLWEFDAEDFEMHRTHWAVKDVDLWSALASVGIAVMKRSSNRTLKVSRRTVVSAASILKNMGHAGFDRLLLEFGVAGLDASRTMGSLQSRSNALAEFAVSNPGALTDEGQVIGLAIVEAAAQLDPSDKALRSALEKDELGFVDGSVVEVTSMVDSERPGNEIKSSRPLSTFHSTESSIITSESPPTSEQVDTPNGVYVYPRVFKIPKGDVQKDLVGVMMPFDAKFDPVYEAIKAGCFDVSLKCSRADDMWKNEKVFDDIIDLIFYSAIIVVDFSARNPNVMYETGICHLLGKPVIPIVQNSSDVPFDLQSIRYIHYLNNIEGLADMKKKLIFRLQTLARE